MQKIRRSQWPRSLRRRPAAAHPLRLWVRITPGDRMSVCCEYCVLSGRGLCDGLITRQEESYRTSSVVECDLETLWMRRPWPTEGCRAKKKKNAENSYFSLSWNHQKIVCFMLMGCGFVSCEHKQSVQLSKRPFYSIEDYNRNRKTVYTPGTHNVCIKP